LNNKTKEEFSGMLSINSEINNEYYPNKESTKYQVVTIESPYTINSVSCKVNKKVLEAFTSLYRSRLLPKNKSIRVLALFYLPENIVIPFPDEFNGETITDNAAKVRFWLNKYCDEGKVWLEGEKFISSLSEVNTLLQVLSESGYLSLSFNKHEGDILFIPLSSHVGFLSDQYKTDKILINSHFFLIEFSDLETKYDIIGEPFGLLLVNGKIINPPIYRRESLFINKDGSCCNYPFGIKDIQVKINDDIFANNMNAKFYVRPEYALSPKQEGIDIAIVGQRIVGYKTGGEMEIPEAGFIIHLDDHYIPEVLNVSYVTNTQHFFGIQGGPLLISSTVTATDFKDPYYTGEGITFPPTVFPPGWNTGKAARLGFGIKNKQPVLIWVEGIKPEIYKAEKDSKGFTLDEFAQIAEKEGIEYFISLDGGGSAQLALGLSRNLRIADRKDKTGEDFERPVPLGLSIGVKITDS